MKVSLVIACEQALRCALAAGREKEGELATRSLEFEFHLQFPCGSPSTELSDFRQSARNGNERECKQTLKNTEKIVTNVISANKHFESTLLQALLSFPALPSGRHGELAHRVVW